MDEQKEMNLGAPPLSPTGHFDQTQYIGFELASNR